MRVSVYVSRVGDVSERLIGTAIEVSVICTSWLAICFSVMPSVCEKGVSDECSHIYKDRNHYLQSEKSTI